LIPLGGNTEDFGGIAVAAGTLRVSRLLQQRGAIGNARGGPTPVPTGASG
jgi:hypothetical protein